MADDQTRVAAETASTSAPRPRADPRRPQHRGRPSRSRAASSRRCATSPSSSTGRDHRLVGESGSGKSVTARTIMGLLTKRATIADADPHHPRRRRHPRHSPNARCAQLRGNQHLDDLPGADELAEPGLHGRPADRRDPAPAQPDQPRRGDGSARSQLLEEVQIPEPEARLQAVSAPALRRPAPARHDRHGARQPARRPDRRRADDRARRHRPGADPQPDQRAARRATAWR